MWLSLFLHLIHISHMNYHKKPLKFFYALYIPSVMARVCHTYIQKIEYIQKKKNQPIINNGIPSNVRTKFFLSPTKDLNCIINTRTNIFAKSFTNSIQQQKAISDEFDWKKKISYLFFSWKSANSLQVFLTKKSSNHYHWLWPWYNTYTQWNQMEYIKST